MDSLLKPQIGSADQLRGWVRAAQPMARAIYAVGPILQLVCDNALRLEVMALYEKGYLTMHRSKDPDSQAVLHLVVRSDRPTPRGVASL